MNHESGFTIHKIINLLTGQYHLWVQMSFSRFLYRKADDYAHNEIISFFVIILGMIMLVGGILITITVVQEPAWLLFIPYHQLMSHIGTLGLLFSLTGLICLVAGFMLAVHYDRKKSWVISQLEKFKPDQRNANSEIKLDKFKRLLEQHASKEKKES